MITFRVLKGAEHIPTQGSLMTSGDEATMLTRLLADMSSISRGMEGLQEDFKTLRNDVGEIKGDLREVVSSVKNNGERLTTSEREIRDLREKRQQDREEFKDALNKLSQDAAREYAALRQENQAARDLLIGELAKVKEHQDQWKGKAAVIAAIAVLIGGLLVWLVQFLVTKVAT